MNHVSAVSEANHPRTATHVLIDLDGTISDSSPGIARSLQYAFGECGYEPPSDAQVRTVIGPPFEVGLPTLGIPIDDVERVVRAYRDRYEDIGLFENTVYPGITEMLDALAAAGHTLSIATAKPEPTAKRIIEHFGFTERFAVQAGATHEVGTGRRTKAEVINYALILLRLSPSDLPRVVMVGDRDHDVEGAHLNGIDCIGVTWGFGSPEELDSAGAAVLVDTPDEVAAAVAATYRSVRP
ncbi:MAG TPA: HAD hydrolase-like protein [Ilumatobacteraceae bacterium]|nr:HAD hydrolase-like protein [Ilumatobacteraceae bacterium]